MNILDTIRSFVRRIMRVEAQAIDKLSGGHISANHITWASIVLHAPIFWAIYNEKYVLAGVFLIFFGLMDTLDGELARLQGKASNLGVFLDSTTDRIKEAMVYIPLIYVFALQGEATQTLVASAAMSGALITSYVRARGESVLKHTNNSAAEMNQIFKSGFARLEIRMAVMIIGLLWQEPYLAIVFIATSSWLTIAYRMLLVERALR